jgi:hypothetical protein
MGRGNREWRKRHNEELHNLYSSPSIVRVIKIEKNEIGGHVARMRKERGVYGVLVGKSEGKRSLGRPRRRWENNIWIFFRKCDVGYGLDWTGSG